LAENKLDDLASVGRLKFSRADGAESIFEFFARLPAFLGFFRSLAFWSFLKPFLEPNRRRQAIIRSVGKKGSSESPRAGVQGKPNQ
jgi:hypothetical protein